MPYSTDRGISTIKFSSAIIGDEIIELDLPQRPGKGVGLWIGKGVGLWIVVFARATSIAPNFRGALLISGSLAGKPRGGIRGFSGPAAPDAEPFAAGKLAARQ
jgi:hypothetical protein